MYRKCLSVIKLKAWSFRTRQEGLTLVDAAIGLIVLGLLVAPLLEAHKNNVIRETKLQTRSSIANIQNAINQYHANGAKAYPCPASVSAGEGDANFGEQGNCSFFSIPLCTAANWASTVGICRTPGGPSAAVVYGAVPFSALGMQQEESLDYWGNRILYAVTLDQTNVATFKSNAGQIQVLTIDDPRPSATEDGIPDLLAMEGDIFLFSTGATGRGGYNKDGVVLLPCGNPATQGYDNENCDLDDIFFLDTNPAAKWEAAFSRVVGVTFFDDITRVQESVPELLWFQHPDNDVFSEDYVISNSTRIGVGTTAPTETVDVRGNIRVEKMLKSDFVCDLAAECFDPEIISGVKDETKCDPNDKLYGPQAVLKFGYKRFYCNTDEDESAPYSDGVTLEVDTTVVSGNPSGTNGACGVGEVVSGINASGEIICVLP